MAPKTLQYFMGHADITTTLNDYYIKFYQCFPDEQIVNACVHNLNWTHIRSLLRIADKTHAIGI